MKQYIVIGVLFLMVSACKPGVPRELIQPDKMGKVLYDIHLADAYAGNIPNVDSAKKVAAAYYKGIYNKFEIDSALYNKSMDYYAGNPEAFSKIYEYVTKELTAEKSKLVKADSIINAKLVKKARLRFKADSTKRADSIAKTPAFKKEMLKKKADSVKRADSIAKTPAFKAILKSKADARRKADSIVKMNKAMMLRMFDSIKRTTPFRWPVNLKK